MRILEEEDADLVSTHSVVEKGGDPSQPGGSAAVVQITSASSAKVSESSCDCPSEMTAGAWEQPVMEGRTLHDYQGQHHEALVKLLCPRLNAGTVTRNRRRGRGGERVCLCLGDEVDTTLVYVYLTH